jgi:hypothetical protein
MEEHNEIVEVVREQEQEEKRLQRNENQRNQRATQKVQKNNAAKKIKNFIIKKSDLYKLSPTEASFKSYEKYTLPKYIFGFIERENDRRKYHEKPYAISAQEEQEIKLVQNITDFFTPTIVKLFLKMKTLRVYAVLEAKIYNDHLKCDEDNRYTTRFINIGRSDFTSIQDFYAYVFSFISRITKWDQEHDYLYIWAIQAIHFNIVKLKVMQGLSYVELPDFIKNRKAIINIKNTDNKCFLYSMVASRHLPPSHVDRVKFYQNPEFLSEWVYDDKSFPMRINKVVYFEKANNVKINIYTLDSDQMTIIPIHLSKQEHIHETVNLFLYEEHYTFIKDFSRFCGSDGYTCPNCLKSYANLYCYKNHTEICKDLNPNGTYVTMPKMIKVKDKVTKEVLKDQDGKDVEFAPVTKFKDFKKQKQLPVVMYADFECSLVPLEMDKVPRKNYVAVHKPNSFRLRIESTIDLGIPVDYVYYGDDSDVAFVSLLINDLEKTIQTRLRECADLHPKPILTLEEEVEFQSCRDCHFCKKALGKDRVRDHCHFTGIYEGAAHEKCNIKSHQLFKGKIQIPVFFHNVNYDLKCILSAFQKLEGDEAFINKISGIPCNMEAFKCLNINTFSINCSYAHLSSSLDTLIKNLPDEEKRLLSTIASTEEEFKLISKKGLYPYEMITSQEKLDMSIELLERKHFDSKLTLFKLSDEEWEHVQDVIRVFKITNFKQYHDLYLKIDVYGLTDVFEYHRKLTMQNFGLDAAHYIGLPQLSWSAGTKFTNVRLSNIQDMDMYMMFEKMKRGGISVISHKHAKANNKYLPNYKKDEPSSYLLQLDCNNLYGKSMCEKLPVDSFAWDDIASWNEQRIMEYSMDSDTGYCLEVDLEYPDHLHDEHNDYPLAPESLVIEKQQKLAPNFLTKTKYVLHIANLKYYLEKGLLLKKIHRVVKFRHQAWLKPYIDFNSGMRQKAKNEFEKDFWKLLNNSFYGKTMENIRDRVNVQFCQTDEQQVKWSSSPLFANCINPIGKTLALVKTHKKTVVLDKPMYLGACILDSSKLIMQRFHYDTMMVNFPNAKMCKTDTDSLLYYIETEDLYEDLKRPALQKCIEFSNYPKEHPLYNCDRKKVPGLFQDECVEDGKMQIISEYVGLCAKVYSNLLYSPEDKTTHDKKKAKGISKIHVKKRLAFDDFKKCLFKQEAIPLDKIYGFQSHLMKMYSMEYSKKALDFKDNKRILLEDGISTLAIGHWRNFLEKS